VERLRAHDQEAQRAARRQRKNSTFIGRSTTAFGVIDAISGSIAIMQVVYNMYVVSGYN
jgi:hypothetical protein